MAATTSTFYGKPAARTVTVDTAGGRLAQAFYLSGDLNGIEAKFRTFDLAKGTSYQQMFIGFSLDEIATALLAAETAQTADTTLVASTSPR